MRNILLRLLFLMFFCFTFHASAQTTILGKTIASETNQPLEYASVALLKSTDSSTVQGVLTDTDGNFSITALPGKYFLKISSLGFESWISGLLTADSNTPEINLSSISLTATSTTLEAVEIQGEKSLVVMSLDKQIFNVGQDLSNAGATAVEILSNIPSVTVDPTGTVKLRGSADVRILIDGRPSGLTRGDGLRQLQGGLIEAIEVVTNPSARYEAEGSAGVINIVLKKERRKGINGSFEVILGEPANYGIATNLNYRLNKLNFFVNYGINYRIEPNVRSLYQEVYDNDTTFVQLQSGEGQREGIVNNIQGGLDYYFNDKNILTASYRFQRTDGDRITDLRYEDYLFNTNNLISTSLRNQDEQEKEPYSEYVISYKKLFEREGHELTADIRHLNYWEESDQKFTEVTFLPGQSESEGIISRQNSINDEYENQYLLQVDYVQPFGTEGKFEAGIRSSIRDMTNDYLATEQNEDGIFVPIEEFDNVFVYTENIHALYGIIGNEGKKWSYQAGLRVEATDIKTELEETNEENPRNYANLFPSALISHHLPGGNDIKLSYSRRIRRPVYRDLSPFVTLADGRNFFSGNPDLDPEFTHSFEIGHLKYFEKGSISSSIYYRRSTGTIQSIIRVDDRGFSTRLPENLNKQNSLGADLVFSYKLTDWWKLDANVNFFRAITDGTNLDDSFEADTYTWFARQTSRFTLPKQFDIQLRTNYDAPEKTPQGKRKAIYFFDLAVQKDLWKSKGKITLSVMDIFQSRIARQIVEGDTFFSDRETQFQRRQINLTLTYRLNQ